MFGLLYLEEPIIDGINPYAHRFVFSAKSLVFFLSSIVTHPTSMLRITFSILAIAVSTITLTVNIEINEWWKYVPMAGLILISLILWITLSPPKHKPKPKTSDSELQELNKEESLADLGILEIRPVSPDTPTPATDAPGGVQLSIVPDTQESDPEDAVSFPEPNNPLDKQTLVPLLQGFRAALGAHAVGVIRLVSNDCQYEVCCTVGLDWIRSRGETFVLKYNLFKETGSPVIHQVGSKGLQSNHLTYSRKPASITRIGVASIGKTDKLLLVDTIDKNGLSHPRAKGLLKSFGQALSHLFYREDPERPRHEIIDEEILAARSKQQDLTFALVVPQRFETLTKMYGEFIDDIENKFQDCLLRADPNSRVVRFGELLFGVFRNCDRDSMGAWHQTVRNEIKNQGGLLTGGVFIGAVMLTSKHQTGDHLRNDASRALTEASQGSAETVII